MPWGPNGGRGQRLVAMQQVLGIWGRWSTCWATVSSIGELAAARVGGPRSRSGGWIGCGDSIGIGNGGIGEIEIGGIGSGGAGSRVRGPQLLPRACA